MRHPFHSSHRALAAALLVCALLALGLTRCGVERESPQPEPPAPKHDLPPQDGPAHAERDRPEEPVLRGHLVWGHESRSFVECDSGREGWVVDATGGELAEVYRDLISEPYRPLFVSVRGRWQPAPQEGFGADFAEQIEITALRHAARESKGCDEDLAGVTYVAHGNEPFWNATIRGTGVVFSELGRAEGLFFPSPDITPTPRRTIIKAASAGPSGGWIAIELTEGRCTDSMSGSRFSFAARVRFDGSTFEGCAREGW